jgi:hypothetical protein
MSNTQYFQIKKDKQEYAGERYFQMSFDSDTVLQICAKSSPQLRKGRANNMGVYLINRLTLLSNYFSYIEPCTKRKFESEFDKMINLLNPKGK